MLGDLNAQWIGSLKGHECHIHLCITTVTMKLSSDILTGWAMWGTEWESVLSSNESWEVAFLNIQGGRHHKRDGNVRCPLILANNDHNDGPCEKSRSQSGVQSFLPTTWKDRNCHSGPCEDKSCEKCPCHMQQLWSWSLWHFWEFPFPEKMQHCQLCWWWHWVVKMDLATLLANNLVVVGPPLGQLQVVPPKAITSITSMSCSFNKPFQEQSDSIPNPCKVLQSVPSLLSHLPSQLISRIDATEAS